MVYNNRRQFGKNKNTTLQALEAFKVHFGSFMKEILSRSSSLISKLSDTEFSSSQHQKPSPGNKNKKSFSPPPSKSGNRGGQSNDNKNKNSRRNNNKTGQTPPAVSQSKKAKSSLVVSKIAPWNENTLWSSITKTGPSAYKVLVSPSTKKGICKIYIVSSTGALTEVSPQDVPNLLGKNGQGKTLFASQSQAKQDNIKNGLPLKCSRGKCYRWNSGKWKFEEFEKPPPQKKNQQKKSTQVRAPAVSPTAEDAPLQVSSNNNINAPEDSQQQKQQHKSKNTKKNPSQTSNTDAAVSAAEITSNAVEKDGGNTSNNTSKKSSNKKKQQSSSKHNEMKDAGSQTATTENPSPSKNTNSSSASDPPSIKERELAKQNDALKRDLAEAQKTAHDRGVLRDADKKKLKEVEKTHQKQIEELSLKFKTEKEVAVQKTLDENKKQLNAVNNKCTDTEGKNNSLSEQVAELKEQVAQLNAEAVSEKGKTAELGKKLESAAAQQKVASATISLLKSQIEELAEKKSKLEAENSDLKIKNAALEDSQKSTGERLEILKKDFDAKTLIIQQQETSSNERIENWKKAKEDAEKNYNDSHQKNLHLISEKGDLELEMDRLKNSLKEKESTLAIAKQRLAAAERTGVHTRSQQQTETNKMIQQYESQVQRLQEKVSALTSQNGEINSKFSSSTMEQQRLQREVESLMFDKKILEEEKFEINQKFYEAEGTLKAAQENLRQKSKGVSFQLEELQQQLNSATDLKNASEEKLCEATKKLAEADQKCRQADEYKKISETLRHKLEQSITDSSTSTLASLNQMQRWMYNFSEQGLRRFELEAGSILEGFMTVHGNLNHDIASIMGHAERNLQAEISREQNTTSDRWKEVLMSLEESQFAKFFTDAFGNFARTIFFAASLHDRNELSAAKTSSVLHYLMSVQQQIRFLSKATEDRPRSTAFCNFLNESKQRYILQGHIILSLREWHNNSNPSCALMQEVDDKTIYCLNDDSIRSLPLRDAITNLKTRQAPVFMIENSKGGGNNNSSGGNNSAMKMVPYSGSNNGDGSSNNNFNLGNCNNTNNNVQGGNFQQAL